MCDQLPLKLRNSNTPQHSASHSPNNYGNADKPLEAARKRSQRKDPSLHLLRISKLNLQLLDSTALLLCVKLLTCRSAWKSKPGAIQCQWCSSVMLLIHHSVSCNVAQGSKAQKDLNKSISFHQSHLWGRVYVNRVIKLSYRMVPVEGISRNTEERVGFHELKQNYHGTCRVNGAAQDAGLHKRKPFSFFKNCKHLCWTRWAFDKLYGVQQTPRDLQLTLKFSVNTSQSSVSPLPRSTAQMY